jgi:hypothetical protein
LPPLVSRPLLISADAGYIHTTSNEETSGSFGQPTGFGLGTKPPFAIGGLSAARSLLPNRSRPPTATVMQRQSCGEDQRLRPRQPRQTDAVPPFGGGQCDRLINVESSSSARELLRCFDTGQRVSRISAAGVNAAFRDAAI